MSKEKTINNQRLSAENQRSSVEKLIEFCLVFLIIFTPFAYGAVEPWGIAIFEITAAVMFLTWVLKILKNNIIEFIKTPITIFIFLFIFYVFLQLFSRYSVLATRYFHATRIELLKIIAYSMIFFVTLNTIKTKQQITRILSVIIATGFLMSVLYLIHYFGVNAPRGIINPDHFSAYLGMIIPLTLGLLFVKAKSYELRAKSQSGAQHFLLFFCVITMSTALFFTMSRGGMFSFIFALLIIAGLVLTRKSIKKKGWLISAVLIFIILTITWLGATPVVEKILSIKVEITSRYFGGRLPIWQGTAELIKDYPMFGTGLGTFNYIFPKYQPAGIISKHYTYAHSDFLELLSETGIIGFSLFALCPMLYALYVFRRFRKRHDPWIIGISIGIFGSLAAIFVHSFADFNLHIPANAVLLTILLSLFIVILNLGHKSQVTSHKIFRVGKIVLYPITALLSGIFIVVSVTPAIAEYYVSISSLRGHEGAEAISKALRLDPTNAAYHYQLGRLYSKPEDRGMRFAAYKKAVELNPTNAKYHQSLAWTYGQLSSLRGGSTPTSLRGAKRRSNLKNMAHKHFQLATSLEPNNPYRHRTYAIWLFNRPTGKNIENGVMEYRRTIELKATLTLEALNTYEKVNKQYSQLKNIVPNNPHAQYEFSKYLKQRGLNKESNGCLKKAIYLWDKGTYKNHFGDIENRIEFIKFCIETKDYKRAIKEAKDALECNPQNFWLHYWRAFAYQRSRQFDKAIPG
ncbi:MAG: O-antigen ligase family protein, partial [Candidatus Omnitrophota bacterium]|nr:O-antigen ligase family protein [Candidatus Omnitrophota bacterium]